MDASTHATKKGELKERRDDVKERRDDIKEKGAEGRYEGGNDSDQNRRAEQPGRQDEKAPVAPEQPFGHQGSEEE